MKFSLFILLFALGGLLFGSCASSKKPALSHGESSYGQQGPSSRTPGESNARAAGSSKKSSKRISAKTHADLVKEFEERMEANAKRYKKEAKLAEKPQYSDPSYFGHKKKPKKRKLSKRKLCKECGIVH